MRYLRHSYILFIFNLKFIMKKTRKTYHDLCLHHTQGSATLGYISSPLPVERWRPRHCLRSSYTFCTNVSSDMERVIQQSECHISKPYNKVDLKPYTYHQSPFLSIIVNGNVFTQIRSLILLMNCIINKHIK